MRGREWIQPQKDRKTNPYSPPFPPFLPSLFDTHLTSFDSDSFTPLSQWHPQGQLPSPVSSTRLEQARPSHAPHPSLDAPCPRRNPKGAHTATHRYTTDTLTLRNLDSKPPLLSFPSVNIKTTGPWSLVILI